MPREAHASSRVNGVPLFITLTGLLTATSCPTGDGLSTAQAPSAPAQPLAGGQPGGGQSCRLDLWALRPPAPADRSRAPRRRTLAFRLTELATAAAQPAALAPQARAAGSASVPRAAAPASVPLWVWPSCAFCARLGPPVCVRLCDRGPTGRVARAARGRVEVVAGRRGRCAAGARGVGSVTMSASQCIQAL